MNAAPTSYRPAGPLASAPLAAYDGPWSPRLAAHLLRRAGFGGSPSDIAHYGSLSPGDAVTALVRFPSTDSYPEPQLLDDPGSEIGLEMMARGADANDPAVMQRRQEVRENRRQQNITNVNWWLNRMLVTPAPLQEKMTLFLHGHFATANNAKGIYGLDIIEQNELLRRYALGNWRELTHYVARDRAMLKWLDNARSQKAHPNENFARELMELFTLGIGNYTEQDVRESARAFTGFTFARASGQFYFNVGQHDDGPKSFLGRTGNFNGDDVIDIIFQQPAAPKLFARELLEFFVYSDPELELVDAFAALIRKNDFAMAPVMSTLLRSNVFFSERAYRALVKSPVEFVIGTYQLFGVPQVEAEAIGALNRMGQVPFHPPSVKGWDGGAAWLNTQTVLARENFVSSLMAAPDMMQSKSWLTDTPPGNASDAARRLAATILQGDASASSLAGLQGYLDGTGTSTGTMLSGENFEERIRGAAYLTMAMPAYQLS
jgi:uncharacterized protein (DUF1800 family)